MKSSTTRCMPIASNSNSNIIFAALLGVSSLASVAVVAYRLGERRGLESKGKEKYSLLKSEISNPSNTAPKNDAITSTSPKENHTVTVNDSIKDDKNNLRHPIATANDLIDCPLLESEISKTQDTTQNNDVVPSISPKKPTANDSKDDPLMKSEVSKAPDTTQTNDDVVTSISPKRNHTVTVKNSIKDDKTALRYPVTTANDPITLEPIAVISSIYRLCVGTPRQGLLAPNSRGRIDFFPHRISSDSITDLDKFSHLWIFFLFHLNTNEKKMKKDKNRQFQAKISPPALGGKKVGIFATRSPHRPNPVGFSLVKIHSIVKSPCQSKKGKKKGNKQMQNQPYSIYVTGLDLVDGTPVIDIKPFVPHYDTVGYSNPATSTQDDEFQQLEQKNNEVKGSSSTMEANVHGCNEKNIDTATVPQWVNDGLGKRRPVFLTKTAEEELKTIMNISNRISEPKAELERRISKGNDDKISIQHGMSFYGITPWDKSVKDAFVSVKSCIKEVLGVDVRSAWQTGKARKGKFQAERADRVKEVMKQDSSSSTTNFPSNVSSISAVEKCMDEICTQQIDNLMIHYNVSQPSKTSDKSAVNTDGSGADDVVTVVRISQISKENTSELSGRVEEIAETKTTHNKTNFESSLVVDESSMINKSLLEVTETSSNKDSMLLESENEISAESITNEKVIATIDSAFPKKDIIVVKDNKTLLMPGLCDKPCVKKIVGDDELELQDDSFSPNTLVLTNEISNIKNSRKELLEELNDEEVARGNLCMLLHEQKSKDTKLELQHDTFSPNNLLLKEDNSSTKNSEIELVKKPNDEEETSDKLCVSLQDQKRVTNPGETQSKVGINREFGFSDLKSRWSSQADQNTFSNKS